jgi:hypothetical protein
MVFAFGAGLAHALGNVRSAHNRPCGSSGLRRGELLFLARRNFFVFIEQMASAPIAGA